MARYAVAAAIDLGASLIITVTETGLTTRLVCKYRPPIPVVAITTWKHTMQSLTVTKGTLPLVLNIMIDCSMQIHWPWFSTSSLSQEQTNLWSKLWSWDGEWGWWSQAHVFWWWVESWRVSKARPTPCVFLLLGRPTRTSSCNATQARENEYMDSGLLLVHEDADARAATLPLFGAY